MNLSLNQTLLTLCETNLGGSIDSGNVSVRGYLPLIQRDSGTHMHGLAVYVKEGLPFVHDLSVENSADSYLCFRLALLHSVSYFFFFYRSPSSSLCMVFDSITPNIDEVFSINPSANVFVFGDFNVHHKDWLILCVTRHLIFGNNLNWLLNLNLIYETLWTGVRSGLLISMLGKPS